MSKKQTIRQPKTKGIAKVPVVIQLEALECGAACLTMILGYYGKWIPLEQVRHDCGVSRDGSSALKVLKAARNYGLVANGYRMEPEALKEEGSFPCIIHWNFNHFVVLNGFQGNKAVLTDPARGNCKVSMEEFDKAFTGICITFEPGEDFEPSGEPKSLKKYLIRRLANLRAAIIISILTTVIASLVGVISPVFDRIFYDCLLTGENPDWFYPFLIGLGFFYAVQLLNSVISTITNYRIIGKITTVDSLAYMWKVLHLPMHFFSQRMTGDIAGRQQLNPQISNTLINTFSPLVINTFMMLFYFVVMIRYSWILTIVGVTSALINLLLARLMTKRRVDLVRVQMRNSGNLSATEVSGIQMIESLKASGAEEGFFSKWAGYYAASNETEIKFAQKNVLYTLLPNLVSTLSGNLILGLGVWLTIQGSFELGSIVAFQGFFNSFMGPVNNLLNTKEELQEMQSSMERVDDVMEYPADPNVVETCHEKPGEIDKLSGEVEIKDITFGYSPLDPPLIKNFSMSLKQGSSVAFVGSSGCGKSTLAKLISGLYAPWNGEIRFDGKTIQEIDRDIFTGSVAVVDQDIFFFEDTVANNIKMFDNSIEDFAMILAARDAQIHYDIVSKDDGYNHHMSEGGREFSGGQRQRLEIARVLAQDPTIIILDEATSALDAKTEYDVVKAIKDRGITCIIIAHRLSTIRDCDEIIVLNHGDVVERGKHDELMALNGYYTALITSE